ncbi:MAG: MerR family transcriptional regulator [Pseudonocardiaceae bacterium]
MSTMRISQLAERSGVPATTLRFYETAGLLPADRTASGYRVYGEDAVQRLAFISAAKHLGLALEEIAELLPIWDSGTCADVKAGLRPRIVARVVEAERRGAELAAFTTFLHTALEHLDALPDRTSRCDPECSFRTPPTQVPAYRPVSPSRRTAEETERWRTTSIACSLTADGLGERVAQWRQLVVEARREEIDDGLRLTLPAERAGEVAALAAAEQQCCPFLDFRLQLDGAVVRLEARAPADGAGLLTELFTPAH